MGGVRVSSKEGWVDTCPDPHDIMLREGELDPNSNRKELWVNLGRHGSHFDNRLQMNPITPKSDQCQISPIQPHQKYYITQYEGPGFS